MTKIPNDETIKGATGMSSSQTFDYAIHDLTGYDLAVALLGKNRETNA
jgi:hypothetical protein